VSDADAPTPSERPGLFLRLRGHISLPRTQAIFGILAACLSIGGSVYGYLRVTRPPDMGEILTLVRDRADKPLSGATVEVLTPKDALVTSLPAPESGAHYTLKEGTYRLRVSHPKFGTETRTVQVIAGQTSEIRFRLAPRTASSPGGTATSPVGDATRAVSEGVESLRKIFR
jgi:hypothetical protein